MRRRINSGLPKYARRRSYGVIYAPYLGSVKGKPTYGKEINLGHRDMSVSDVWIAYERVTGKERDTLRWMLNEYHQSKKFRSLGKRTQKDYQGYRDIIIARPMASGKPFGEARLDKIRRTAIQKYIDTYPAPISANRHIQYLKAAWNWAQNRLDSIPDNPCMGVELNKQEPRQRYVTQEEFRAFKQLVPEYVQLFMELAYLCRARWSEVANLTHADILPEGLRLERSKGSEGEITAWTPRLKLAVVACKALNRDAPTRIPRYLIRNRDGRRVSQNAFQSAWQRGAKKWGGERFTFHDIKAAGYSDQSKQDAGHRSEKMHKTYSRKLRIVEPPE